MIGSHSARQHSPTSPWRGKVGERSKNASRVGVKLNHPTPAARKMLAADPPRPGEGEARVMLGSEPITRIPYHSAELLPAHLLKKQKPGSMAQNPGMIRRAMTVTYLDKLNPDQRRAVEHGSGAAA